VAATEEEEEEEEEKEIVVVAKEAVSAREVSKQPADCSCEGCSLEANSARVQAAVWRRPDRERA
jgi:hypothetical protein